MEKVVVRPKESTMSYESGGNSNGNVTSEARRSEIDTGMQANIKYASRGIFVLMGHNASSL